MNSSIYRQILFGAKFHELRFILALSCGQKNTMAKCKRLQGKRPCWRSKICQKIESWWWWIHGELSSENFLKKFYMWAITKVLLVDNIMLIVFSSLRLHVRISFNHLFSQVYCKWKKVSSFQSLFLLHLHCQCHQKRETLKNELGPPRKNEGNKSKSNLSIFQEFPSKYIQVMSWSRKEAEKKVVVVSWRLLLRLRKWR